MNRRHVRIIPVLMGALGLMLAIVGPALAAHGNTTYRANLHQINDPGAHGTVDLQVSDDGETVTVTLEAERLDDGPHAAHIHGFTGEDAGTDARCPSQSADEDGDGLVDIGEGAPSYGAVQIPLSTSDDSGESISYERTFDSDLGFLDQFAIVVHGVDLDGNGTIEGDDEAFMPALCGTIVRVGSAGRGQ